jgi:hypothetical protein
MNKVAQRSISWHDGTHRGEIIPVFVGKQKSSEPVGGFSEDSELGTPNNPVCPGAVEFHGKLLNNCSCYTERGTLLTVFATVRSDILPNPLTVFATPTN